MLFLLIPRKRKVKNVDVYIKPLIDELEELWRGIEVTNLSRPALRRYFFWKAILMWMVHDFPSYGHKGLLKRNV